MKFPADLQGLRRSFILTGGEVSREKVFESWINRVDPMHPDLLGWAWACFFWFSAFSAIFCAIHTALLLFTPVACSSFYKNKS
ncbi:transmembrane protein, putative [Medicago truncatula]|uniref:Transmembrane protein, putative n=1 Tax=Medicago truncatula TaxID=3880 RepID=A0A072UYK3_MEDTR|nr:transmembrane protein, putative [Medicago truncatula]